MYMKMTAYRVMKKLSGHAGVTSLQATSSYILPINNTITNQYIQI